MAKPIKLIQLNIERGLHLPSTLPFLQKEAPDIVCLQEVLQEHVPQFEATIGGSAVFEPMSMYDGSVHGVAIVAKHRVTRKAVSQLGMTDTELPVYVDTTFEAKYKTSRFVVLVVDIDIEGTQWRVATTHLPVTDKGAVTDFQRDATQKLLGFLSEQGDVVLVGDFNAPRGAEIFSRIASQLKDNVPPEYKTSIDLERHRNGKLRPHELADKMVDGVFSTPGYNISHLRMESGVSDHLALIASVEKL